MTTLAVTGHDLTLESVEAVARHRQRAALAPAARAAMERAHGLVRDIVASGRRTYGVSTGFGALSTETVPAAELCALQVNLLRSHAAGVGPPLDDEVVRAMLLLRANVLARGHSGTRPLLVERLLDLLDHDALPVVPAQGSVGASGDLAPLASLALPLIGEGRLRMGGQDLAAAEALARLGLAPIVLGPKEGLALINGTQASAAIGALAVLDGERLLAHADLAGALSLEALRGRPSAFDERLHRLRPLAGQLRVAANLRTLLDGSQLVTIDDQSLQDAYALRCMPQVHGASREMAALARRVLDVEVNAVTDNPLVFPAEGDVISGGNFHGEPLAQALDALAIGLVSLAAIAERRIDRLLAGALPELPLFLCERPGSHSGLMMAHVTAASLLGESRVLAHPASVDSVPTSAGKEDHVSFSTGAARKARQVVENVAHVLAIELLAAAQALDFQGTERAAPRTRAAHALVREAVPHLGPDREIGPDIARLRALVASGRLLAAAGAIG